MEKDKVKNFNISSKTGKRSPCLSEEGNLCCNQLITTTTFMSQQAKQTFDIFFTLTVKVNVMFIRWDAYYGRFNILKKQRRH